MDNNTDYKQAYERQKQAREKAEDSLENTSRELYELNAKLRASYDELKAQEATIVHQEKLASIGQLSAGIVHEINNPAGFIKSNLSSLQKYSQTLIGLSAFYKNIIDDMAELAPDAYAVHQQAIAAFEKESDLDFILEDFEQLIHESLEGAQRISEIIQGLKIFSRIDDDKKERLYVNECIQSMIKIVRNEVKYKADLRLQLGEIPQTMGYPGSLSQVFLNLVVNASQAMTEFGAIIVRSYCEDQHIIVEVEDNGSGMDAATQAKIFDAFYTTKAAGVGTGLGLSISMSIVEKHGGTLTVRSELGQGTCFTVTLPVIDSSENSS